MVQSPVSPYQEAILKAYQAFKAGNLIEARRLANLAMQIAPEEEEPWLIIAAISPPKESIAYLKRALEINPESQRARKGMHWAVQRQRKSVGEKKVNPTVNLGDTGSLILPKAQPPSNTQPVKISPNPTKISFPPKVYNWVKWGGLALAVVAVVIAIILFSNQWIVSARSAAAPRAVGALVKPTLTATNTPTPTATFTATQTATSTSTPTKKPTKTPKPTKKVKPTREPPDTPVPEAQEERNDDSDNSSQDNSYDAPEVSIGEGRWIDVDLTHQQAYAYDGNNLERSFVVSTGTWQHPTVTGQFQIYVMYRYADMAGPGYYLSDVPYVMYFYKGYGLHGTYWHNNFGTPMSHGCINFKTEDAGWIFNWASVGTPVNIHY